MNRAPEARRWSAWRQYFERNQRRLPPSTEGCAENIPVAWWPALAASLARFQLGEAGEGRIAREIDSCTLSAVDDDYRASLKLFVREEGRHALILAGAVRALRGELLRHTWTESLFRRGRRLLGVRLKLLVLLCAEVISLVFYGALARVLPLGPLRSALDDILVDEAMHRHFHCAFFRRQASDPLRRGIFRVAWHLLAGTACAVVLLDHRRTLEMLGVSRRAVAQDCLRLIRSISREVCAPRWASAWRGTAPRASLASR